jgi:periplasmic copper chaperone A
MLHTRHLFIPALMIAACAIANPSAAHEFKAGALVIDHPWTRATPKGARTGAGYMAITNHGQQPDRLVGGTAEGIDKIEVHEMTMANDVMQMRQLASGLEIKPGETVELKPSGIHLMMIGLKEPLEQGRDVKATLSFEKAGSVPVTFEVEAMGSAGGGHAHGAKH